MATLVVEHADGRKEQVELSSPLVIGRGDDCGIKLDDNGASRRHLKLELDGEGRVWMEDLASANGTYLEGQRITARTQLTPGLLVMIGSARLSLASPPEGRSWGNGLAGLLLLLSILGAVWGAWKLRGAALSTPTPSPSEAAETEPLPGGTRNPRWELEQAVKWCRIYAGVPSSSDPGEQIDAKGLEPDWKRAETACERARALGPASPEVLALVRQVEREKGASELFEKGERALERLEDSAALELFGQIDPESLYYERARQRALEAAEGVRGRAEDDCRKASREKRWADAVKRCATFLNVACQSTSPEEIQKKSELELLRKARKEGKIEGPDWSCPAMEILRQGSENAAGLAGARAAFQARYPDREVAEALVRYWSGHATEAVAQLNAFSRSPDATPAGQGLARRLLDQIAIVEGQVKAGQSAIGANEVESAARVFREALQTDAELMGDEGAKNPSAYRRSIEESMGVASYAAGNLWAGRNDWSRACRFWKLGFSFTRSHLDLSRALVNNCSGRAADLFRTAQSCRELDAALEFATEGDGVREQVDDRRAQLRCP